MGVGADRDPRSGVGGCSKARSRRMKKAVSTEVESTQDGVVTPSEVSEATETRKETPER